MWRAPTQLALPVVRVLPDGTYLTVVMDAAIRGPRRDKILNAARAGHELADTPAAAGKNGRPMARLARVIEYDVPDRAGNGTGELTAVVTTITDPDQARADELAAAYHQRWEYEICNDQLKTHLRGPGTVLRSRLPDLVHQEIWSYLIVHHAISTLIAKASATVDLDPDRISFAKALRLIHRSATGTADTTPQNWNDALPDHRADIAALWPQRRQRTAPTPSNARGTTTTGSRNPTNPPAPDTTSQPQIRIHTLNPGAAC